MMQEFSDDFLQQNLTALFQFYSNEETKAQPDIRLAELGDLDPCSSVSLHSPLFLLRPRYSRQMLKCLWQIMDIPACYTKHLWMQDAFWTCWGVFAGDPKPLLKCQWKHELEGNHQGDLPSHMEFRAPAPFMPFYGTSIHPGCLGKYSQINMQVVLRIFYI